MAEHSPPLHLVMAGGAKELRALVSLHAKAPHHSLLPCILLCKHPRSHSSYQSNRLFLETAAILVECVELKASLPLLPVLVLPLGMLLIFLFERQ